MATNTGVSKVTYEELADLEEDFDIIELEILRKQTRLQAPLYAKRAELVSRIPNFWPLVIEQAPPDVDQFIQPSDSVVLCSHLTSIDVNRFEVSLPPYPETTEGNPRSVAIRFSFTPNEWFEDEVLEKKFWFRRSKTGWTGLVSEPARIRWKEGMDLTDGLTEAAFKAWEAERKLDDSKSDDKGQNKKKRTPLPEHEAVIKKMETATEGSLSFFTWFAYRGRHITAEESEEYVKAETKRREDLKKRRETGGLSSLIQKDQVGAADGDDEEDEDSDLDTEVFPAGEELAIAISDDLFPGAVKYFTQAQEDERLSDADFEEMYADDDDAGDEDDEDEIVDLRELVKRNESDQGDDDEKPRKKKRKT